MKQIERFKIMITRYIELGNCPLDYCNLHFTEAELKQLISELEATQSLRVKITKLNPTYGVSDGYMDGYYAAISDVENIIGESK